MINWDSLDFSFRVRQLDLTETETYDIMTDLGSIISLYSNAQYLLKNKNTLSLNISVFIFTVESPRSIHDVSFYNETFFLEDNVKDPNLLLFTSL